MKGRKRDTASFHSVLVHRSFRLPIEDLAILVTPKSNFGSASRTEGFGEEGRGDGGVVGPNLFEKGCAKEEWNEECEVAVDGGTRGRFEEQQ